MTPPFAPAARCAVTRGRCTHIVVCVAADGGPFPGHVIPSGPFAGMRLVRCAKCKRFTVEKVESEAKARGRGRR